MAFEWDDGLVTGHLFIDSQHRELCARVDRLLEALLNDQDATRLRPAIDYLEAFAVEHFETEETTMRAAGFPGLAAHIAEHIRFHHRVCELRWRLNHQGPGKDLARFAQESVAGWLREHMRTSDREMAAFLARHAAKRQLG